MEKRRRAKGGGDARYESCEREEMELYRERLREMEVAFGYNLNLLADRDADLDILEEQLRNGIVQLERLSREKENCQQVLRLLDEEKKKEATLLNKKLNEREKAMKELERRNDGNLRTLKKALDDMRREQQLEKRRAESALIRVMQLKETEYLRELRRIEKRRAEEIDALAQAERERQKSHTENRNARKVPEEDDEMVRMRHSKVSGYGKVGEEGASANSKGMMTECQVTDAGTQTSFENTADLTMLLEQNDVLKRIIKNLKGKMKKGKEECEGCRLVKGRIEETNKRFEEELMHVKREVQRERLEEEVIIQSLERSLSSLKDNLVKNLAAGHDMEKLESRISQRLEQMDQELEEVRRKVDTGSCAISLDKTDRNNKRKCS